MQEEQLAPLEPGSGGQAGSLLLDLSRGFLSLFFCPLPTPVHSNFKLKYLSGLWSALSLRGVGGWARGGEEWDRGGAGRGAASCHSLFQKRTSGVVW